nr:FecR family protein [uncultured Cupriavidus sp.]
MTHEAGIDPRILDEAANWLMRLHATNASAEDRAACARWQAQSASHAQAWVRAERLMSMLGTLPPGIAMRALDRPNSLARRKAVARLAGWLAVAPAAWAVARLAPWEQWVATHSTGRAEQREFRLADGTRITLGPMSAIDVAFDTQQRRVELRAGEILVETAPDPAAVHRPFIVSTAQGQLEALGTRFDVQVQGDRTRVAVLEGAVRVQPREQGASARVLRAGEQSGFTASGVEPPVAADDSAIAWTRGMLVADRMPLAQVAAQLGRYRSGIVRCDPAIAALPVSGALPIGDTDRTLSMLMATYPVDVVLRTRLWVTLVPRTRDN